MFETIVWISIIIGFVVVIILSMTAMILTRRREQNTPQAVDYEEAVRKVDAASDAALTEINKISGLIMKDIDEKYQQLLFLYELMEEKSKKLPDAARVVHEPAPAPAPSSAPAPIRIKKPIAINAKHEKILQLHGEGVTAADIAKELGIGQGEVKLIIDLAGKG